MRNTLLLSLLLILFSFASARAQNEYPFKCGEALTFEQVRPLKYNNYTDYSEKDIKLVDAIDKYIAANNDKSVEYEVFINQRTDTSLILDIFGLEKEEEVDKTSCGIFNSTDMGLPARVTLLFHRYINESEDGGIVVAITQKK